MVASEYGNSHDSNRDPSAAISSRYRQRVAGVREFEGHGPGEPFRQHAAQVEQGEEVQTVRGRQTRWRTAINGATATNSTCP